MDTTLNWFVFRLCYSRLEVTAVRDVLVFDLGRLDIDVEVTLHHFVCISEQLPRRWQIFLWSSGIEKIRSIS